MKEPMRLTHHASAPLRAVTERDRVAREHRDIDAELLQTIINNVEESRVVHYGISIQAPVAFSVKSSYKSNTCVTAHNHYVNNT